MSSLYIAEIARHPGIGRATERATCERADNRRHPHGDPLGRQGAAAGSTGTRTYRPGTVAAEAGCRCPRLHYHFGSKNGLILALLEVENQRRLERQRTMYAGEAPLWKRYEQACDYLEDDLESGYVRVLQEMIAAGWSEPTVGAAVRSSALRLV
ncbi:MAG: hypothetical protein WKF73_04685 [Nocardioidaceae bacterium]